MEAFISQHNPVTLISGGARGIGAAIAAHLASHGGRVIVADRDITGVKAPDGVRLVAADVAREDAVLSLTNEIRETEGRLDGLVCNAGFMIRKPIRDLRLDEWRSMLDTHLTSAFLLVRATEDLLRDAKGSIITIASTRAHMSEPDTESYAASKGGLLALTHALAISLGPEVRVNCISPGWIDTKQDRLSAEDHAQHPAGRVGVTADIATLAAFLLGRDARFITGAEFIADGGMTRKMIYAE
jgi:NAD(P)-dependent dehydrogenase (short-subunit alcohol dehydrogenase family)